MKYKKVSSIYTMLESITVKLREKFDDGIEEKAKYKIEQNTYITLDEGFAWDGSTGVMDTKQCMLASAVHDALCHYIDKHYKGKSWRKYRKRADKEYKRLCRSDGMSWIRRNVRYTGVRTFGNIKGIFK